MEPSIQQLARQVIDAQNACNIVGLSNSFAEAMRVLHKQVPVLSTESINTHPIAKLWASKIHDLAGMGLSDMDAYGKAYKECQELAAG